MAKRTPARDGLIMNLVEMREARVESHKLSLPVCITGEEDDTQRAVIFHAAAGKLEAASKHISARGRLDALASIVSATHNYDVETTIVFDAYYRVIFDPANWTVLSFHNHGGARLTNSTIAGNPQVLKPLGDMNVNMAAADRRGADIAFVIVSARVDLSTHTKDPNHVFTMETVIALPRESHAVLDGHGNAIDVYTFGGLDDIRAYTPQVFKRDILERTGQKNPHRL